MTATSAPESDPRPDASAAIRPGFDVMPPPTAIGCGARIRSEKSDVRIVTHEGKTYFIGKEGQQFSVVLTGPAGEDTSVLLQIDGVSVVTGQPAQPSDPGHFLSGGKPWEIEGYFRKNDQSRLEAFVIGKKPESLAASLAIPNENIGEVRVKFYEAFRKIPASKVEGGLGTKAGTNVLSPWSTVAAQRGSLRTEMVFYYGTEEALTAAGIITPNPPTPKIPDPEKGSEAAPKKRRGRPPTKSKDSKGEET